jgi:hypothetical protein
MIKVGIKHLSYLHSYGAQSVVLFSVNDGY